MQFGAKILQACFIVFDRCPGKLFHVIFLVWEILGEGDRSFFGGSPYWLVLPFRPQILGIWWGPINAIHHSENVDEVVVILKSGQNTSIHSINFHDINDDTVHCMVWM